MAAACPNRDKNLKQCNCTYSGCDRHGVCCECLHYHRRMGELPACFFTPQVEKTYDRSVERFMRMQKGT